MTAGPGTRKRCKLSVIAEASAEIQSAFDPAVVAPYGDHFYPPPAVGKRATSNRRPGQPMYGITAVPYIDQVRLAALWEEGLRLMFPSAFLR